ncbi:MAG: hypothetical protein NT011_00860 [Kiritimatiellaeota bacterium]|nr:hypothetical protein [Kiritimatiellota bacterium]
MTTRDIHGAPRAKVTIGLAALCAQWFEEVGLRGSDMAATLSTDYDAMVQLLSRIFGKVVVPGVISTPEEAVNAVDLFRREQIDALLLVHIMWSEDQPLLEILRGCEGVPLLLWNYHPTGSLPARLSVQDVFRFSGTVGMLQGSAPMQRLGLTAVMIAGTPGDPDLTSELEQYAAALRIHNAFRSMRAGRIAGRCEAMTGTHVDPEALSQRLGVTLVEISAAEYAAACVAVARDRVEAWSAELARQYKVSGVSAGALQLACRNALALDDLVVLYDLAVLAIQDLDPELHRLAGIRPCLYPPQCARRNVAIAMESDLTTGLGMLVTMRAAAAPALYTELFTFDPRANLLLMGHAAAHDPRLADADGVTLVPDGEYRQTDAHEGVWQEFIMRKGPVTCVSLYDTGQDYRMVAFDGVSIGAPRRIEGFAHAAVMPDVPVAQLVLRLVQRGMTQHFAVVPGRIVPILRHWCALSGVEFVWESVSL